LAERLIAEKLGYQARQSGWDEEAKVVLARKLAVVLHRMWVDGTQFAAAATTVPGKASRSADDTCDVISTNTAVEGRP
jgi:hypothetical protein